MVVASFIVEQVHPIIRCDRAAVSYTHLAAVIGVFAAVVFILGIMATKWEEGQ